MPKIVRLLLFVLVVLGSVGLTSCEKEKDAGPSEVPFPVDTASADQYVVCMIDTIQYIAYTRGGGPDEIRMSLNSNEITKFVSKAIVSRNGQPLTRSLELHLYKFKERRMGNYTGAQIFSESRTDVLVNRVDVEEKRWNLFNAVSNRIQVTFADSNLVRGNFNFKMQNAAEPSKFIEVTKGAFKLRIR